MNYKQEKMFYMVLVIFLSLIYFIVLPFSGIKLWNGNSFSFGEGLALMALTNVILVWFVLSKQFLKKGNLNQHKLEDYKLIWTDEWKTLVKFQGKNKKKKIMIGLSIFLTILIPLLIYCFYNFSALVKRIPLFFLSLFLIYGTSAGLATFIVLIFNFLTRKFASPQLKIYKQGILYIKNFFKWKDIKSLYFPEFSNATDNLSNSGFSRSGKNIVNFKTLKLVTKDNETYVIQIYDKKGFQKSLNKINKIDLLSF